MVSYYRIQEVKNVIGEKGNTNNEKIRSYGLMADNYINALLTNVNNVTIPLTAPSNIIKDLSTALAIAYFFRFESGDTELFKIAEDNINKWFTAQYMRPKFKARIAE